MQKCATSPEPSNTIDTVAVAARGGRRTPRSGSPRAARSAVSAPPAAPRPTQLISSGGGAPDLHASAHVMIRPCHSLRLAPARLRCAVC
jgi:hypothetical protein